MANVITGKVLMIGQTEEIKTKDNNVYLKRDLLLDCTRFDPYTGERAEFENTPLLEFGGEKGVIELNNIKVGDVVSVSFDLHGTKYEKGEETKYFTRVRPYKVEIRRNVNPTKVQQPNPEMPIAPLTPSSGEIQEKDDDMPF